MEAKEIEINGAIYTFLRYKDEWVFPVFDVYENGLGSPIAMFLYSIENGIVDYYADITVNLPECERSAGCQFIDMNNNDAGIMDWLEENKFGERTGKKGHSGFCTYPEFNFYKGEKFWEYGNLPREEINNLIY
jgi:hypothetical protein